MTALMYDLLKPVSRSGSLQAAIFSLIGALLKGSLVFRSTFLPRILGVLSAVGGLGWLTCLYEPLASRMAGYIVTFAVVAGLSTALWLLVFGVNEQRWREQATAAGQ